MAIHLGRRATPVRQIVAVVAGLCVALVIMFWQDAWTDPSEFLQLGISGLRDRAQYAAVGWDNRKDPRLEDVERDALNLEEVFGKRFFQRSVSYGGTRTRLRQVLRKVLRGEPIRIGYLGGSITAGAGVGSVAPQKYLWPGQVLRLLNETFPNAENEVNGAGIGGLGSVYFAWCGAESLAEDADIIILEHTVNNDGLRETSMAYEEELRAMLSRPNRPAVIGLECFQMVNLYGDGGVNAGALHRYYDAPYLSLKTALLPEVIAHPGRIPEFFGRSPVYADGFANIDLGHYTLRGHYAMGSIVSHFILDEVKSMFAEQAVESDPEHHEGNDEWDRYVLGDKDAGARFDQASFDAYVNDIESWRDERMWGSELYYSDIPRVRMFESFNWDAETPLPQPRCESLAGSKKKIEFESIDPGVKLNDDGSPSGETGAGWQEWKAEASFLDKSYIRTTSRGAIVRIKVQVSGQGEVMLQYLRSNTFGLGKVGCWVDDNKSVLTILDGQWDIPHNLGSSGTVAKGLAAGEHHLHCQLIEGKEFRIIALMTR